MKSINSFEQPGDVITLLAPYAVEGGDGMAVGALFGIAANKAASGASVECCTTGVFRIAADSALTGTPGAPAYWDSVNRRCAGSGIPIGNLVATKLAGATVATVRVVGPAPGTVDTAGNTFPLTVPGLWANRATLAAAGSTSVFFTDIGIGGSFWFYSGGRWRPQGGRVMLKNSITDVTNNLAPEIVMDYATILPGLWQDGDILDVFFRKSRTGGTSDTDASLLKFSGAAATPGTPTGLGSGGALTTTTIDMSMRAGLRRLSSTSFRPINIAGAVGVGSGNASPSDVTGYQNMDSTTNYLQICSDLTTAGGEISVLRAFTVELIAGA